MKNNSRKLTAKTRKRPIAILVAVVFLLTTVYLPSGVFAADETGSAGAAETEQTQTELQSAAGTAETDLTEDPDPEVSTSELQGKIDYADGGEDFKDNEAVVVYKNDVSKKRINNYADGIDMKNVDTTVTDDITFSVVEIKRTDDINDAMEELADSTIVDYVQPNYRYSLPDTEIRGSFVDEKENNNLWHIDSINGYDAKTSLEGKALTKVSVAVIDTGVSLDHPDLQSCIDKNLSWDLYGDEDSKIDSSYVDQNGHGTHVCGIIGASYENSIGGAGVASAVLGDDKVNVIAINVFEHKKDNPSAFTSDIIEALAYAKSKNVKVVNMSLGIQSGRLDESTDKALEAGCDACVDAGITLVAAAGNDSTNEAERPSDYESVISVIALNSNDTKTGFSNYGEEKDISAPGYAIYSTYHGGYEYMSGTSQASPIVASCAAMMYSIDPDITVSEVKSGLYNSANDLYDAGWDEVSGYGKVMASGAVQSAIDGDYREISSRTIIPVAMDTLRGYLSGYIYTYDGHAKTPSITLFNKWGNRLLNRRDYSTSYSGGRSAVGTYSVTAVQMTARYYGSQTKKFTIIPKGTSVKKLYRYKGAFRVKWGKQSTKMTSTRITGYQVQYSKYSNMTVPKTRTIKGYKNTRKTIRNLGKNKKYYVRIRTYMKTGGITYYSNWSGIKSVKTR